MKREEQTENKKSGGKGTEEDKIKEALDNRGEETAQESRKEKRRRVSK